MSFRVHGIHHKLFITRHDLYMLQTDLLHCWIILKLSRAVYCDAGMHTCALCTPLYHGTHHKMCYDTSMEGSLSMFCMEVMEHFTPSTKRGTSTSGTYHVIFGDQLLIETDIIVVQEIRIHRNALHMYTNRTYSVGVV